MTTHQTRPTLGQTWCYLLHQRLLLSPHNRSLTKSPQWTGYWFLQKASRLPWLTSCILIGEIEFCHWTVMLFLEGKNYRKHNKRRIFRGDTCDYWDIFLRRNIWAVEDSFNLTAGRNYWVLTLDFSVLWVKHRQVCQEDGEHRWLDPITLTSPSSFSS